MPNTNSFFKREDAKAFWASVLGSIAFFRVFISRLDFLNISICLSLSVLRSKSLPPRTSRNSRSRSPLSSDLPFSRRVYSASKTILASDLEISSPNKFNSLPLLIICNVSLCSISARFLSNSPQRSIKSLLSGNFIFV